LGDKFNLRDFYDYVWSNGSVPFSLELWELLGLDDGIRRALPLAKQMVDVGSRGGTLDQEGSNRNFRLAN
jgi:hypothetical protein